MLMCRSLVVICHAIAAGVLITAGLFCSAQQANGNPQSVEKRVDDLLAKVTLDEKIDLISGDTPFRTHSIPRLNIPFFQMADGPVGAHIPAPTIAYAAGIGLAASWSSWLGAAPTEYAQSWVDRSPAVSGNCIVMPITS
jgi:beta-glucosidase